ncbi:MAG: type II toxin-antitoxin system VapB family antitoxin, partial [Actinomycetia bacterium]|nr:type II toxin-antitoxin system VapB family antitoxin [Actinomycetes bacterium]
MSKTTVDIDDRLLEEAKKVTGTTTKKDTVNEALRMVAR